MALVLGALVTALLGIAAVRQNRKRAERMNQGAPGYVRLADVMERAAESAWERGSAFEARADHLVCFFDYRMLWAVLVLRPLMFGWVMAGAALLIAGYAVGAIGIVTGPVVVLDRREDARTHAGL